MLLKPKLSTVSNIDWTNVRVGAFKATASTTRHHQSQSQLHPRVLFKTHDVISYQLFLIFEKSLALGKLPLDWKLAKVTALYKKGSK